MGNNQNTKLNNNASFKLPMDYSARFYPITATKKSQSLYVMGAKMKEEVDATILKQAANETIKKFPSFSVRLKKGFAWYYFEHIDEEVKVFPLDGTYLKLFDGKDTNGYLFRVYYGEKLIEVELFHGLTDGNGAFTFIQELVTRYQELKGADLEQYKPFGFAKDIDFDNIEDGFDKYYRPLDFSEINLKTITGKAPHTMKGTYIDGDRIRSHYTADAIQLRNKSKEYGASVNSYMAGVIAYAIDKISNSDKPIIIMIPVNLRAFFPLKTMRNFVSFVRITIEPNSCKELKDYVAMAHEQLKKEATKEKLEGMVSTTVKTQKSLFLRITPLFIKRFFVRIGKAFLKSRQTIIFSNLGRLELPEDLGVEAFTFNMNASKTNPHNLGIITYNNESVFTFVRSVKETIFAEKVMEVLKNDGIRMNEGLALE